MRAGGFSIDPAGRGEGSLYDLFFALLTGQGTRRDAGPNVLVHRR
jgi:hypothetical protein